VSHAHVRVVMTVLALGACVVLGVSVVSLGIVIVMTRMMRMSGEGAPRGNL